jgi:hypothetical protein
MAQLISLTCFKGEAVRFNFCLNPFTVTTADTANGAGTVNVVSTAGFPAAGTFYLEGAAVTYSALTATAFTGCAGTPTSAYPAPAAQGGAGAVGCRDVTGWTTRLTIRKNAIADPVILNPAGVIVSPLGGVFKVVLTKAQTTQPAGAYAADFWRTDAGSETALGVGSFTVQQESLNP